MARATTSSKSSTATTGTRKTSAATARGTKTKAAAPKTTASKTTAPKTTAAKAPAKFVAKSTRTKSAATKSATKTNVAKTKPRTRKPAAAPAPVVVAEAVVTTLAPEMKKPELIDLVVAKTGAKKREVKAIVEAILGVLGTALRDGRPLNLEPMGKVKVNRSKHMQGKQVSVLKLRQSESRSERQAKDPQDPLASAAE